MFWRRPYRILMVEDNVHNHDLYREVFSANGFDVTICRSAEDDFIGEVRAAKPDVITMDLMISLPERVPTRDGFDAIKLLRTERDTAQVPIMVLSNFVTEEKLEQAKALGAIDYFNPQGQSLSGIASQCHRYLKHPRRYTPSHPAFR